MRLGSKFCTSTDQPFLELPIFKTDPLYQRVSLKISAASDEACAIRNLFDHHLSIFNSAGTISRNYVTRKLQDGIRTLGYGRNFMGHSFRRGTATLARFSWIVGRENTTIWKMEVKLLPALSQNSPRLDACRVLRPALKVHTLLFHDFSPNTTTLPPAHQPNGSPPPQFPAAPGHLKFHNVR